MNNMNTFSKPYGKYLIFAKYLCHTKVEIVSITEETIAIKSYLVS